MTELQSSDNTANRKQKIGVLLLNLGTPDATDYWSIRRYLGEFLSDKRVIETPRLLWWPILNLIILSVRPQKTGANYALIWDKEHNASPLRVITEAQTKKLAAAFAEHDNVIVDFGMRYGNPSTESRLKRLQEQGCEKILIAPLYPQYSASTVATAVDKCFDALKKMRFQPTIRVMPPYYDKPEYIKALGNSIRDGLAKLDFEPDLVVATYHGMPVSYVNKGDPYREHCIETTRSVAEYLGFPEGKLMLTFQSRFGSEEWLQPYTDETLKGLGAKGIKKLAILSPAFSADCIETLEEIVIGGEEEFMEGGGERYAYIPCLNDSPEGMEMLESIIRRELMGWI